MENHSQKFKIRLGLFVAGGLALFVLAIFIIGKQKNLFNPVFKLTTTFYNISGLQVGNNIRFMGITVGTVDNILITNDSTVKVEMLIRREIKKFIKADCQVAIGSEGLIGDRLIVISQGSNESSIVGENQHLDSQEPVEMDAIMGSVQVTTAYAEIIAKQLAEIMININNGNGTLGRLIQDSTIAHNLDMTILNLRSSSKGLDQNMEAAKHNILLKGYFNKKARAAENAKEEAAKEKEEKEKLLEETK